MTPKTRQTLESLASHFDLRIEYVSDLPDKVPGCLQSGPEPRYIFINASKPACDQAFTIAHELAHYVLHVGRKPMVFLPAHLNLLWKTKLLHKLAQLTERWTRQKFDVEWQANLWAFILLWQIGAVDDLCDLVQLYPDKKRMFWYSCAATVYSGIKRRVLALFAIP